MDRIIENFIILQNLRQQWAVSTYMILPQELISLEIIRASNFMRDFPKYIKISKRSLLDRNYI